MAITENLFIFADAVNRQHDNECMKLNIYDNIIHFFLDDQSVQINTDLLAANTTTCIVYNQVTNNLYTLYNFKELCGAMDLTSQELLTTLQQRCFMQIEKNTHGELFIKAFLFKGMNKMPSDTNDFSENQYCTMEQLHPLDNQFGWHAVTGAIEFIGSRDIVLYVELIVCKSKFYRDTPIYCNYGGQCIECDEGLTELYLKPVIGEDIYVSTIKNSRNKGRVIPINYHDMIYANDELLGGFDYGNN